MKQINERIEYLKKAIKTLRSVKYTGNDEINRIISICDYEEELEQLEAIKKANSSLF